MKRWILAAAVMVSSSAFAFDMGAFHGRNFNFEGSWKMPDSSTGRWTAEMVLERQESELKEEVVRLTSKLKVYNGEEGLAHEETSTLDFVKGEAGFFTVRTDGKNVGEGYCYGRSCHYRVTIDGEVVEETYHGMRGEEGFRLFVIGSSKTDQYHVAWQGRGIPQRGEEQRQR